MQKIPNVPSALVGIQEGFPPGHLAETAFHTVASSLEIGRFCESG